MITLGFGYFWFTDTPEVPAPPPLVLDEKPSAPPTPDWREEARDWEVLLAMGKEVPLDIFLEPGKRIEMRLFDKTRSQSMLADLARLNNAVNRPAVSLGRGPGFVVILEKALLKVNAKGDLTVTVTSQMGSLKNAQRVDLQKFLQGGTLTVPLESQELEGDKGSNASVAGSMQFTLKPRENRVNIEAGLFRVTVNVPSLGVKNESDEALVKKGYAQLFPPPKAENRLP